MQKTKNYNLNKPEAADPMRVSDFNENADKIDGLLKQVDDNSVTRSAQVRSEAANALAAYKTSNDAAVAAVSTSVSTKAEQSAVDALTTAVAAGMKMQTGTYKGNGKYGSGNPNKLTLNFSPKFLMIWGPYSHIALGFPNNSVTVCYDYTSWSCTATWSGNTVSWYCGTGAQQQMNENASTYYYLALG